MMNAAYTHPARVRMYVRSATHRQSGAPAVKVPFHQVSGIISAGGFGGANLAPPAGNTT